MSHVSSEEIVGHVLPPPLPRKRNRKNPILAAVLGFLFGPFGTLYFGWKVLVTTLIVVVFTTFAVALVMPFQVPRWFMWAVSVFYAFWNPMLASAHNAAAEVEDEELSLAMNLIGRQGWYVLFDSTFTGIYSAVQLLRDGRWFAAIFVLFVLTPLVVYLVESVMAFILAAFLGLLERRQHRTRGSE